VAGAEHEPGGTEVEKRLIRIWSEVLRVPEEAVGIHTNFFDIGGHSLKVMRIINNIKREFQVEMKLVDFFERPSVYRQSQFIQVDQWLNEADDAESPIESESSVLYI